MKSLILLFIFILSSTNCSYMMKEISIDGVILQPLDTSSTKNGYFYLELGRPSDTVYLLLVDNKYSLISYNLEVCYTDKNPLETSGVISSCKYKNLLEPKVSTNKSLIEYIYKYNFSYDTNKKYIIVHYSGLNPSGSLHVKASYNEIKFDENKESLPIYVFDQNSTKDTVETAVQAWIIIVIVVSVISGVVTIIIIIVIVMRIRNRRVIYPVAPMGYVAPPTGVVYNPPVAPPTGVVYNPPVTPNL